MIGVLNEKEKELFLFITEEEDGREKMSLLKNAVLLVKVQKYGMM